MATLDDSPSVFSGECWSTWLGAVVDDHSSDNDTSCADVKIKADTSSMKLRKQDMGLYGVCPAQDEFFLSVCEKCGQVVKPQALLRHIEQRHGQKISSSSKKSKSHSSSKHSSKNSHRGHKTSPSSKADKSHRSRSAEGIPKDGSVQLKKNLPVVKVERIDTNASKGSVSPVHTSNVVCDKPKASFKQTYKKGSRENSQRGDVTLSKQDTVPIAELTKSIKSEPISIKQHADKLLDLRPKELFGVSWGSRTNVPSPDLPNLPKPGSSYEVSTFSLPLLKRENLSHNVQPCSGKTDGELAVGNLPNLPSKSVRTRVINSPDMPSRYGNTVSKKGSIILDAVHKQNESIFINSSSDIPDTFVARDNEELVEKFEKMESEIWKTNLENSSNCRIQMDDINTDIKIKLESELQKIKVEDKTHVFQIDNRSSTPVLHIPESPKSEPPQSPKSKVASQPPNAVHSNGANSQPNSRPSSRPPSVTPSGQGSCPTTQIKMEPLFPGYFKPVSSSNPATLSPIKQGSLLTSTSTFTNLSTSLAVEMNSVLPMKGSMNSHNAGGPLALSSPTKRSMSDRGTSGIVPSSPTKKHLKDDKCIPCKDRIYDPEKHCGVWVAEQARHCTRSLTCKSHSLSLRRSVHGRSKSFDEILNEHKAAKEATLKLKTESSSTKAPPSTHHSVQSKPTTPTAKASYASKQPLSFTKTVTVTSSTPVMSVARSHKSALHQDMVSVTSDPVRKLVPFSCVLKPAVLPLLSSDDTLPLSDIGCDGVSSSEEDGEDKADDMYMLHHPAPIAVNGWGARQYGSSCYAFNQCCDRLRNAFSSLVDFHSISPPHKKLCLEPKSAKALHYVKDPHKHTHHSDSNDNVIHTPAVGGHTNSLHTKHKSKSGQPVIAGRSVKAKTTSVTSVTNSNTTHTIANNSFNNVSKQSNVNANLKRKRSGGTANSAVSAPSFTSPISITIPPGLNLASLGNTINATLVTNPIQAQAGNNNVSIVVSNPEQFSSLMNGQFMNLQGLNLAETSHIQLSGTEKDKSCLSAKIVPALQSKHLTSKINSQPMQIDIGGNTGAVIGQLASATVLMDTGQSANSFLSSSHVAMDTKGVNSGIVGKVASHSLHSSGATGLVFKKDGVPNGVLSSQGAGISLKNMPFSINHVSAGSVTVSDLSQSTENAFKIQGRNNRVAAKLPNLPKQTVRPNLQQHTQNPLSTQHIAAALSLTPHSNRLLAPSQLQQMYANQMLSGVAPLHLQSKNPAKSGTVNKTLKQPLSLTIMAPGLGLTGTHPRPLLISSDTTASQSDLTEMTASPSGHVT